MKLWNLHTHSVFSDGKNTIEEMVQAAIDRDFCVIGMSDHSYTPCDESYCMMQEDYVPYLAEVERVKKLYADRIQVLTGLELDYFSQKPVTGFDYTIGSVHYVEAGGKYYAVDHAASLQKQCVDESFGGSFLAMARRYFEQLTDHILTARTDVVGHFDVIAKFSLYDEQDPAYRKLALEAMDAIAQTGAIFEVNTGGMARGYRKTPYPIDYMLRHLLEKKVPITWGADCHNIQNTDFAFAETLTYLKELGFRTMAKPTGKGFEEIAI